MHDPEVATVQLFIWLFGNYFSMELGNAEMLLRAGPGWARLRIGAEDPLDRLRRAVGQPRDCDAVPGSAASAKRISAESECEPVFFMTAARWFSTVRWLMPRSAAMFLLGWPASTSSMIWRWRAVRPARRVAAASRRADNLAESRVLFQGALDAGEQFVAADRLLDEIRSPGLHGLDCHRHVALAGDHDSRQPSPLTL